MASRKPTPRAKPAPEPTPVFDAAWLVGRIREGAADRELLVAEAYRQVFQTELGRIVLLHHLMSCGVGQISGPAMTDSQRSYGAGMHDAAVQLAADAGYDQAGMAVQVLTDVLPDPQQTEEHDHGRSSPFGSDAGEF